MKHSFRNVITACIILCLSILYSCSQRPASTESTTKDSTITTSADSLSIDLVAWQQAGKFPKTTIIEVHNDPVFHKAKSYEAVLLSSLLMQLPGFQQLNVSQTQLVFECEDGYTPSVALEKVLSKKAYVAVRDMDAPKETGWIDAVKENHVMKVAPFYVVYIDVATDDYGYKWPYNLVRMRLSPISEETKVIFPKEDDTIVKGYDLFRMHCLTCHSINDVGGKMGPELNFPKNVTEYWHISDIKAFVKNPSAYRHDCKMPSLAHVKDSEIDEIIRYLQYMTKHKIVTK